MSVAVILEARKEEERTDGRDTVGRQSRGKRRSAAKRIRFCRPLKPQTDFLASFLGHVFRRLVRHRKSGAERKRAEEESFSGGTGDTRRRRRGKRAYPVRSISCRQPVSLRANRRSCDYGQVHADGRPAGQPGAKSGNAPLP